MDNQQRDHIAHLVLRALNYEYERALLIGSGSGSIEEVSAAYGDAHAAAQEVFRYVDALSADPSVAFVPLVAPPWRAEEVSSSQRHESGSDSERD
jgi:hypothetical protein